jgi:hypothetical protein
MAVSTDAPVTKTSNKTKNANGRGSTYIVTKANGKKVRKAAINDVNGKRRVCDRYAHIEGLLWPCPSINADEALRVLKF